MGAVSLNLPRYSAAISPDQPGDFTITQTIHLIVLYTTIFSYTKMMAVHIVLFL